MPGLYAAGDYDLAGFCGRRGGARSSFCRAPISKLAMSILALASSGVHANGFSLVRRVVERSGLVWNSPAPFAKGKTLGEVLIEPTRIYVRPLLQALRETGADQGARAYHWRRAE